MQPSTMLMNLARVLLTPVTLGDRRIDLPYVTAEASRVREILGTDAVESSSCSVEALNRDLSGKKVWVFLGHTDAPLCGDRTLAFSRDGVIEVVQISTIVEIVRSHQLDLVVLNGCNGAQLAEELLGAGVPIVVYWSTMVHDEAAKMFSVGFFQALAAGSNNDTASLTGLEALDDQRDGPALLGVEACEARPRLGRRRRRRRAPLSTGLRGRFDVKRLEGRRAAFFRFWGRRRRRPVAFIYFGGCWFQL